MLAHTLRRQTDIQTPKQTDIQTDINTQTQDAAWKPYLVDAQVEGRGPRAEVGVLAGVAVYVRLQPPNSSASEVPSLAVLREGYRIGLSAVCLEKADRN